jgi:CheY-like chemotaxis protein
VTILIVDDDAASAKLIAVLLRGDGLQTRIAASAEEALALVRSEVPDAIVLDLVLPMMSGISFAQLLKATASTRHIPIIAVSAFNGREAERVAFEAGCCVYVRKPIDALSFTQLVLDQIGGPR